MVRHPGPPHFGNLLVSLVFALTGVQTAILGSILPAILAEWHLSDSRGGALLFVAFLGSTLGAAIVHRPQRLVPAAGLLLCGMGTACTLLLNPRLPQVGFLLYGLGLGITMTAISLLQSQAVGPAGNHQEMNRLNLLWAVGACCAPALALHSLQRVSVDLLLRAAVTVLSAFAFLLALFAPHLAPGEPIQAKTSRTLPWAPVRLCLFAGTAVALETALGSWLTTYTQRHTIGAGTALSASTVFWLGLLLSRLLHAMRAGRPLQSRRGLITHVAAVVFAAALLAATPQSWILLLAGFLAGWGLGPLYPLALALALPQYRPAGVFVAAGLGSSLLPWLTGALSTALGSLRAGMVAPCFAVSLLVLSVVWMWSEIPEQAPVPA